MWNDNEGDGPDDADEVDAAPEADDEETTIPCPYCKRPIHEDSYRCPHCGNYLSEEDSASSRKPWWIIVGALLVLYVVYRWIVG
ncbi:MAG: zinc ribbon domain-containing protein [Thermoguttaceae bacterium]